MLEKLKKEVWSHFKQTQVVYFATSGKKRPRVRPVTLVYLDGKFYIATGTKDAIIKQIKNNKNIEFCYPITEGKNSGYIRGVGRAVVIKDIPLKKKVMGIIPFIKELWQKPDDPGFTLLEIKIRGGQYLRIGEFKVEKFKIAKSKK
ncbi:MAG: pyridoxamine 5'-phosphate oxidase family protein [Candidatus Cloacimonetes bacterium]|nr:pyridoxamine 5'-phosphate oxidase family protein [Candidatus Cloacimonadota bacterium]